MSIQRITLIVAISVTLVCLAYFAFTIDDGCANEVQRVESLCDWQK